MSGFSEFALAVRKQFEHMSKGELFVVDISKDELWEKYLAAFPEGTNPIYRTRTEHDCSCCKNFIRNVGNIVSIINGELATVWDCNVKLPYPYEHVADTLAELVRQKPITSVFRSAERSYGAEVTRELLEDGTVKNWNHFHASIAVRHFAGTSVDAVIGALNTTVDVFRRGLKELSIDALNTVLELIDSNSLYRGEEHRDAVSVFLGHCMDYRDDMGYPKQLFPWAHKDSRVARFRNTVIGTLVQDLSNGVDLETAVKSFEHKVAPENYKRPTAIITQRMVQDAMKTVRELDLEPALDRRMARMSDITVNNVLWADNTAKQHMKGGIESLLMEAATAPVRQVREAIDIGIDDFVSRVLPQARSLSLLIKNAHQNNFMVLTAPVHENSGQLFKWDNDFGWSYDGNTADSIKERVKKAGGSVVGDLCCRLAWDYEDDLDFHMYEPGGTNIYYATYRRSKSPNGGMLDLDANGIDGIRSDPAENIVYADRRTMREGVYRLSVHNFNRRSDGVGFDVEIEFDGKIYSMHYPKVLRDRDGITVAEIEYSRTSGFKILKSLSSSAVSREKWGVNTETFVRVQTLMNSPNHWDGNAVGNKHWFFVLEGCKCNEPMRGIYNEFLNSRLEKHRKVFEVLGSRTKCQPSDDQLAGLGFSSTRGDTVVVRVEESSMIKTYNIKF